MSLHVKMLERKILKDVLETYRFLECLWDPKDKDYLNREARAQAYEILLDKYKAIDSEANVEILKRRLENMRCSYKRELKKVIASRLSGFKPHEEYRPTLWYFNDLLFLDEKKDPIDTSYVVVPKTSYSSGDDAGSEHDDTENNLNDMVDYDIPTTSTTSKKLIYSPPNSKRKKTDNVSVVHDDDGFEGRDTFDTTDDNNCEVESFGRTIGLQLKGLSDLQRHIAEKLMSDLIYFGRLNQLNLKTCINLNEEFQ